jgi:hypothetical protein
MQLALNYRGGPLSVDDRGAMGEGVTRAGDRAPDARLRNASDEPVRLFDILRGPQFTLLAVGEEALPAFGAQYGDALRVQRIVRPQVVAPGALLDGEGQMHRIYGEGLILIRPDGYVGYTGPGRRQGLGPYLARFFG